MSYTYPEALSALESIANDFIKALRPNHAAPVVLICDAHAQTASVTWNDYSIHVNMPVRPATSTMSQAEFEDWTSYLLHELGHPTFTAQDVWFAAVKAGLGSLTNATEDVRMEKAVISTGIVPNAKAVLSRLIARKVAEARAKGWKPNSRREIGWTLCVLGRAANGYAIDASDLAWIKAQIKAGGTVERVLSWALPELAACSSTADCMALAEKIRIAIAAPAGTPEPDQAGAGGTGNAGSDKAGEAGEQGSQASGEATDAPDEEDGSEGQPDENATNDAENAPEGQPEDNEGEAGGKGGKGHGDGTTDADETPVNSERELVGRDLAPEGEQAPHKGRNTERLVIEILRNKDLMNSEPKPSIERSRIGRNGMRLREAAAQASRQRALLARALRANETEDREGGRRAGRLDRGALTRAMAGAPNVFCKREIAEGHDTDVCVLLDASGSMGPDNMRQALEVGLTIAQAASSVGAPCTVETFNSTGHRRAGGLASRRVPNAADFGPLVDLSSGGTPLSSHMARIATQQAKRAGHKRRVVFVVTDGGCDFGPETVKRMASYLEQSHGTVFGHVSIGTPLAGCFKAEVCVPWNASLSDLGLEHFVKVLRAL